METSKVSQTLHSEAELFQLLKNYFIIAGTSTTPGDLNAANKIVYDRVLKYNFTKNQVERAFEIGLRDDMERLNKDQQNFYKVSGAKFLSWLDHYHSIIYISGNSNKEPEKLTAQEKIRIANEAVFFAFKHYENTGAILDYGNAIYNHLWRTGSIKFDELKWNEYISVAENSEKSKLIGEKTVCMDKLRRIEIDSELQNLSGSDKIKSDARRLALKDYFDSLHEAPKF